MDMIIDLIADLYSVILSLGTGTASLQSPNLCNGVSHRSIRQTIGMAQADDRGQWTEEGITYASRTGFHAAFAFACCSTHRR